MGCQQSERHAQQLDGACAAVPSAAVHPGLVTGLFGIGTVVIIYLFTAFDSSMYVWYDYVLGILYFFASFFFCYRSPMYWSIGRIKGYPLSDRSAYGLDMNKIAKA